jgi:hypothetical protein
MAIAAKILVILIFCSFRYFICFKFLLVQRVLLVVKSVVQTATLLAFKSVAGDEIAHVDHIAQFADVFGCFYAFEEVFGLFIEEV